MERSEAIEIVREYYPSSGKDLNEALEALIPELKENEDERIRKELIEHVKDQQSSFISAPDCRDRYEEEENDKYNSWIAWLEKQGSQNLANSAKTCKVEPKFKVGDWVRAISRGNIFKILSVNDGLYRVLCYDGVEANYPIEVEKDLAYWTIQDAKDGDVLVYEEEIFMIKSYALWNKIVYHCCYDGKILHKHSIYESWGKEDFDKVHPATEEQRDLLFQKIKEAGYEWDAEKKELRKIEQKPSVEICPHSIRSKSYLETGYPVEQNPAWSEEDEEMLRRCISATFDHGYLKECDWLKSLKSRVQPQPKSEWSKEDEININEIIETLNIVQANRLRTQRTHYSKATIDKDIAFLKSLKERYTWKPSDEQMKELKEACDKQWEPDGLDPLYTLYQDLKNLKG